MKSFGRHIVAALALAAVVLAPLPVAAGGEPQPQPAATVSDYTPPGAVASNAQPTFQIGSKTATYQVLGGADTVSGGAASIGKVGNIDPGLAGRMRHATRNLYVIVIGGTGQTAPAHLPGRMATG